MKSQLPVLLLTYLFLCKAEEDMILHLSFDECQGNVVTDSSSLSSCGRLRSYFGIFILYI